MPPPQQQAVDLRRPVPSPPPQPAPHSPPPPPSSPQPTPTPSPVLVMDGSRQAVDGSRQAVDGSRQAVDGSVDGSRQAVDGSRQAVDGSVDGSRKAVEGASEQPAAKRRRDASPPPTQRHLAAAPVGHQLVVPVRSASARVGLPLALKARSRSPDTRPMRCIRDCSYIALQQSSEVCLLPITSFNPRSNGELCVCVFFFLTA